ncbi:hypothetical protein GLO73106DRAFT_00007260, partial [Gloeocapsa sp. PCC 73106]
MIAHHQRQSMTPQEYLLWEEQQPMKYEYMNGQVFAMTGEQGAPEQGAPEQGA